jgi:hypothetical protein
VYAVEPGGQRHARPQALLRLTAHTEGAPPRPQLTAKAGDWQAEAGCTGSRNLMTDGAADRAMTRTAGRWPAPEAAHEPEPG